MSLQYRIRSKSADQRWELCVHLTDRLVLEAIDRCCVSDSPLQTDFVIAGVLHLFSPRGSPYDVSPFRVSQCLTGFVASADDEYRKTWPKRDPAEGRALIEGMTAALLDGVRRWDEIGKGAPPSRSLAEQLAAELVTRQYVIFHHTNTTSRDVNHWGI